MENRFYEDGFNSFISNFSQAVSNPATGVGTGRDPNSYNSINAAFRLSYSELQALYRNSKVIENVICKIPDSAIASLSGWDVSGSNKKDTSFSLDFFSWLEELNFWDNLHQACYMARLYGDGFLLLDIQDGQPFELELKPKNIKSLDFLLAKGQDECFALDNWQYPTLYSVNRYTQKGSTQNNIKYHQSRLLHLTGKKLFGQMLQENAGRNDSIINQIFNSYSRWETAQNDVKNLLNSHSLLTFGVNGLSRLALDCEDRNTLWQRFETMMLALNVMKAIPYDAETEKVEFANRNFTGVKESFEIIKESLLASTDLPAYIVFGATNGTAFSESGLSERLAFDSSVQNYNLKSLKPVLKKIFNIAKQIRDSPAYGIDYCEPIFNSTISLTDLETAQLYKELSTADANYIQSGVLTAEVIQQSRFAQAGKIGTFIQMESS